MSVVLLIDLKLVNPRYQYRVGFDPQHKSFRIQRPNGTLLDPIFRHQRNAISYAEKIIMMQYRRKDRHHIKMMAQHTTPNDFVIHEKVIKPEREIEMPIDKILKQKEKGRG